MNFAALRPLLPDDMFVINILLCTE